MTYDIQESFEKSRIAGSIAAGALDEVAKIVKPGISTNEIDKICYEFINDHSAYSAPLFYRGFPKSCCTSANHVVCHGIPSDKVLKEGDIINVDVTAYKEGWHGDTSRMFKIGEISIKAKKLIAITYESMMKAIKIVKEGIQLGDIGSVIQNYVEASYPRSQRKLLLLLVLGVFGLPSSSMLYHPDQRKQSCRPIYLILQQANGMHKVFDT